MSVMDNVHRKITTDYVVNLLDNYIEYQNIYHIKDCEKNAILAFIVFIIEKGGIPSEK